MGYQDEADFKNLKRKVKELEKGSTDIPEEPEEKASEPEKNPKTLKPFQKYRKHEEK
jgi:hypothetical protein